MKLNFIAVLIVLFVCASSVPMKPSSSASPSRSMVTNNLTYKSGMGVGGARGGRVAICAPWGSMTPSPSASPTPTPNRRRVTFSIPPQTNRVPPAPNGVPNGRPARPVRDPRDFPRDPRVPPLVPANGPNGNRRDELFVAEAAINAWFNRRSKE